MRNADSIEERTGFRNDQLHKGGLFNISENMTMIHEKSRKLLFPVLSVNYSEPDAGHS